MTHPARNLLTLHVDTIAAMLNCEFTDHPVYDGLELQRFADERHGDGMLAFLSRRDDHRVDYYAEPGLRLDRDTYHLGGGIRSWTETRFDVARLEVTADGVAAHVRFTDIDGREIEVVVDDRDGHRRRRAGLLAPFGAGIEDPRSLLLVWMPGFDLVRASGRPPVFRIDGRDATIGSLPGSRLHRRHLVKYAAPLITVSVARNYDGVVDALPDGRGDEPGDAAVTAVDVDGHVARIHRDPALPDPSTLPDGAVRQGTWWVTVDDARLTGGEWTAERRGDMVTIDLDVTERWRPHGLPPLMRVVTRMVPVFRRWPTTYRWRAVVTLGDAPVLRSAWERTGHERGETYRRRTGG